MTSRIDYGLASREAKSAALFSGNTRGIAAIRGKLRVAMVKGGQDAIDEVMNDTANTIAKKRGVMRRNMKTKVKLQGSRTSLRSGQFKLTIEGSSIKELLESATPYAKYHIKDNGYFESYKKPTTAGTKPVDVAGEIMPDIRDTILSKVNKRLRAAGLEAR